MIKEKKIKIISYCDTAFMLSIGFLYFLRVSLKLSLLWPRAAVAVLLLLRYLPVMSKSYKIPAWIFTIIGFTLLLWKQAPPLAWAKALTAMMPIVAIISVMQTLSISMGTGDYNAAVSTFLRKHAKNQGVLYYMIMLFSHFLCSILNLGEVIIVLNSIHRSISEQITDYQRYIRSAISRGHCTASFGLPAPLPFCSRCRYSEWNGPPICCRQLLWR